MSVRNQGRKFAANKTARRAVSTARWVSLTCSQPGRGASPQSCYGPAQENIISRPHCRAGSTQSLASIVGLYIICPDDDRKCPSRQQWSELQRDDRIAAECASHPLPRNKFSLLSWQAVAAMAALLHSCLDHQRMLMRRMQWRRSL